MMELKSCVKTPKVTPFNSKERFISGFVLLLFAVFCALDVYDDFKEGSNFTHLALESTLSLIGFIFSAWFLAAYFKKAEKLKISESSNEQLLSLVKNKEQEVLRWKTELLKYVQGLSGSIEGQFSSWALTPAECDVALLLLKGLSVKEIAGLRNVSDRTVRQQTAMIYEKSGLSGRSELAAFFLEEFLGSSEQQNEEALEATLRSQ